MPTSIDDPRKGFTKGMPSWHFLAGTPWQLDPTKCPHHIKRFVGTVVDLGVAGYRRHTIYQRFRCMDCGRIHDEPRDARTAGRLNAIEIDDPRVFKTLRMTDELMERFHHNEVYDGRYANKTFRSGLELEGRR